MNQLTRVTVVGTTGSGKTTFARKLATQIGAPHVELDELYWGPDWRPRADFVERVQAAAEHPRWVIDGNFATARKVLWPKASCVVWLDFRFGLTFARALRRTASRVFNRETLWSSGNRESLGRVLFNPETALWWVLRTHAQRRREYRSMMADPDNKHIEFIVLRSPAEAASLLQRLRLHGQGSEEVHRSSKGSAARTEAV